VISSNFKVGQRVKIVGSNLTATLERQFPDSSWSCVSDNCARYQVPEVYLGPVDETQQTYAVGTVTVPDRMSSKKPDRDPKEEALFRKWMGDAATFRGEAKCQYDTPALKAVIDSCPCEPHWPQNEALTEQSRAKVKRHISTNLKAFPVCRHSGQPAALAWDFRQMPDGYGFDGFYVVPRFTCACWSNR